MFYSQYQHITIYFHKQYYFYHFTFISQYQIFSDIQFCFSFQPLHHIYIFIYTILYIFVDCIIIKCYYQCEE